MLVQKLLLLVLKVNAAGIKVTTTERIKTAQRKDKDCLCDMYEVDFSLSIVAFFALFLASFGSFSAVSTMGLVLLPTDTSWLRSSSLMDAS
ncbi:hypothetical protein Tco_1205280 [Tanacetum coccineum]